MAYKASKTEYDLKKFKSVHVKMFAYCIDVCGSEVARFLAFVAYNTESILFLKICGCLQGLYSPAECVSKLVTNAERTFHNKAWEVKTES